MYKIGFRNFVIPKIESLSDFVSIRQLFITNHLIDSKFTILIETPGALLNSEILIRNHRDVIDFVFIGSHDYCNLIGCENSFENLIYIRQSLLCICKAFSIPIVDIVSANISNKEDFEKECISSFKMGFDGKALIHPFQLDVFNKAPYYSKDEVIEAFNVLQIIEKIGVEHFSVIKYNGKFFEKPHLKKIQNIVEFNNKRKIYDL